MTIPRLELAGALLGVKLANKVKEIFQLDPIRLEIPNEARGNLANEFNARWLRVEEAADEFWQRMHNEFLEQARKRDKWNVGDVQIKIGELVMMLDEANERLRWPLAEVLDVVRNRNGRIQTVRALF